MVIIERQLEMHGSKARSGGLALVLRRARDGYRFTLKAKGADAASLDTGNRDITVAFEFGKTGDFAQAQFVQNRNLTGKKNVFALPKNKKKKHRA